MSNNLENLDVWVIGAGQMAIDHTKVLQHLGVKPKVIGRGEKSAKHFEAQTGCNVIKGGLDAFLRQNEPNSNTHIIIAVGTEALMPMLLKFKDLSFSRILVEKPAAISIEELLAHQAELKAIEKKVFVAYNRRYYPSVQKAIELIKEDGGLLSMHFEFTEWSHKIAPLEKAPGVKENWFFANSTHVVDLAFFIAGQPKEWQAYSKQGTLDWHEKSFFTGAGTTKKGVLFTYHSNWESAGNWKIELMTPMRKIILNPLEKLRFVIRGTVVEEDLQLNNQRNCAEILKHGLFEQLHAFLQLDGNESALKTLDRHIPEAKYFLLKMIQGQ